MSWTFYKVIDTQRDIAGRFRARIQLVESVTGEVETFVLKFQSLPTAEQRQEEVKKLVAIVNAARTPVVIPKANTILTKNQIDALTTKNIVAVKLDDGRIIEL